MEPPVNTCVSIDDVNKGAKEYPMAKLNINMRTINRYYWLYEWKQSIVLGDGRNINIISLINVENIVYNF